MMRDIRWAPVVNYEGLYRVSENGLVEKCQGGGKLMKSVETKRGYLLVGIRKNGKVFHTFVHRLVGMAFIPNPNNYPCINHKNGIKTDNRVENLEWCTHKQNDYHADVVLGIHRRGEKNGNAKLTENLVREIRKYIPLYKQGKTSCIKLAEKFGFSDSAIYDVLHFRRWVHVK